MRFRKKLAFSMITVIFALTLVEFTLQALSLLFPRIDAVLSRTPRVLHMIEDQVLGTRPNPDYPGHDRKGFRNKFVPNEVSIVAMGDSQTYGTGVAAQQAWPQKLGKIGKISTYNMAWIGYGPVHSLLLLEEAIDMKPKLIIEPFYMGNDLYNSYYLVYDKKPISKI